jgi:hypothetical protein
MLQYRLGHHSVLPIQDIRCRMRDYLSLVFIVSNKKKNSFLFNNEKIYGIEIQLSAFRFLLSYFSPAFFELVFHATIENKEYPEGLHPQSL